MLRMKSIGEPYAGKPHVRFDEGAGLGFNPFPLYSTVIQGGPFKIKDINTLY